MLLMSLLGGRPKAPVVCGGRGLPPVLEPTGLRGSGLSGFRVADEFGLPAAWKELL